MALSVLLVDDDAAFRAMLGLALRRSGITAETAPDGPSALKRLERRSFDWLITDFGMSPMDGNQLCREARRLRPRLKIAVVSGVSDAGGIEACHPRLVFSKPVPLEKLVAAIRSSR